MQQIRLFILCGFSLHFEVSPLVIKVLLKKDEFTLRPMTKLEVHLGQMVHCRIKVFDVDYQMTKFHFDNLLHFIQQMLVDSATLSRSPLQVCFKWSEQVHINETMMYREQHGWIITSSKCELTTNNLSSYWYHVKNMHEV